MNSSPSASGLPVWPLIVTATLLPVVATFWAYALSIQAGYVPACVPFVEGCTSISRAARYGLGNHVFRALVLPAATLQLLMWWLVAWRLGSELDFGRARQRALVVLGLLAGSFLVLYATFLGTEGPIYRLLRQYGVIVYFASTYLAMLLYTAHRWRNPVTRAAARPFALLCLLMLLLGIASTIATAMHLEPELKDRVENALEWQLGLFVTLWLLLLAWAVRNWRLALG